MTQRQKVVSQVCYLVSYFYIIYFTLKTGNENNKLENMIRTEFSNLSRVWDCKFVPICLRYNHHIDTKDHKERLTTSLTNTGDDCKAYKWTIETGEIVLLLKGHQGQTLRNVGGGNVSVFSGGQDNTAVNHDRIFIAMTAGNDGTATVCNLTEQLINYVGKQNKPNVNIE